MTFAMIGPIILEGLFNQQPKGFSIKSFVFWSKEEISESKDKRFIRDHKNSTVKS